MATGDRVLACHSRSIAVALHVTWVGLSWGNLRDDLQSNAHRHECTHVMLHVISSCIQHLSTLLNCVLQAKLSFALVGATSPCGSLYLMPTPKSLTLSRAVLQNCVFELIVSTLEHVCVDLEDVRFVKRSKESIYRYIDARVLNDFSVTSHFLQCNLTCC